MHHFNAGEEVTVRGTVLRERDGLVELQLSDRQLLRVPFAHAIRAPEAKAMKEAPENKAVTNAPDIKGGRSRQGGRTGDRR